MGLVRECVRDCNRALRISSNYAKVKCSHCVELFCVCNGFDEFRTIYSTRETKRVTLAFSRFTFLFGFAVGMVQTR